MGFLEFDGKELKEIREKHRACAVVKCRMLRPTAGGVPAKEEGVGYFVEHHLEIPKDDPEHDRTVKRIMEEEIGERDDTPDQGELADKNVYAVNLIRRNEKGPFLLEHMVKACLKVAASRLEYFVKKRGSKGDMSEMGTVLAHGASLKDEDRPWEIYLVDENGVSIDTEFHEITGTVSTPQGRKSISHHTEVTQEGAIFEFEFRWPTKKIKPKDIAEIISHIGNIGIGSVRSLEYGGFEVMEAQISWPDEKEGEAKDTKQKAAA